MSDSDTVTMNIPDNHPLFESILNRARLSFVSGATEYATVTFGDVSARLALASVEGIHQGNHYRYLETSWRLLRDNT